MFRALGSTDAGRTTLSRSESRGVMCRRTKSSASVECGGGSAVPGRISGLMDQAYDGGAGAAVVAVSAADSVTRTLMNLCLERKPAHRANWLDPSDWTVP